MYCIIHQCSPLLLSAFCLKFLQLDDMVRRLFIRVGSVHPGVSDEDGAARPEQTHFFSASTAARATCSF